MTTKYNELIVSRALFNLNSRLTLTALAGLLSLNVLADEPFSVPQVDLAIKTDGQYVQVQEYQVPKDHEIGDGTIAYEGPGIESSKVAYRLYLDERSVLDVFGKKTTDPVLQNVGRGDDYHTMSNWGMDILKAGNSLGAGGLGVYEDGKMRMVGPAQDLSVKVAISSPDTAAFIVMHDGLESASGTFDLHTRYSMTGDSRLLTVLAKGSEASPALAAGLVKHPGAELLKSADQDKFGWAYIATYGVIFNDEKVIHYKVAAAWVAEPNGITDIVAFKAYLNKELERLKSD